MGAPWRKRACAGGRGHARAGGCTHAGSAPTPGRVVAPLASAFGQGRGGRGPMCRRPHRACAREPGQPSRGRARARLPHSAVPVVAWLTSGRAPFLASD